MAFWNRKKRGVKLTTPDGLGAVVFPPSWISTVNLYGLRGSYGAIYRTQPNVRAVVDFHARQIASIKLKLYEKVPSSPTLPSGRLELDTHPMVALLNRPPGTTRTKLWRATIKDMAIYDIAIWQKIRSNGRVAALVRQPPSAFTPVRDPVTQRIVGYRTSRGQEVPLDQLVVFQGYDPEATDGQVSPLETLRRVLAEEYQAGQNRQGMWMNASRKQGVIERPADAPEWTSEARDAWRADWQSVMSGADNSGKPALLEDGMKWVADAFSPEEMEYLGARMLTRKECAAAFGIDPRLVFATDDVVTPDVRTSYYVDRLNPDLVSFAEEIDAQLLTEFELDIDQMYSEFNIEAKLRGSFEEMAKIGSTAVGGPTVTLNEWRARINLPPLPGGDDINVPLNTQRGGGPQASPQAPMQTPSDGVSIGETPGGRASIINIFNGEQKAAETPPEDVKPSAPEAALRRRQETADKYEQVLLKTFKRQARTVLSMAGATKNQKSPGQIDMVWLDGHRWDAELAADLQKLTESVVDENARRAMRQIRRKAISEYNPDRTRAYIQKAAENSARRINAATKEAVAAALADDTGEALQQVFDTGASQRAALLGTSFGTAFINFARDEGGKQGGAKQKVWIVTSRNSRHPELSGETAAFGESFSNGLEYPGQFGDAGESANCQCLMSIE